MQPLGQSPEPIRTVTTNAPTPDAGVTSYQLAWPMRSGLRGWIPASRGSAAMTRATACSGLVTVTGTGVGEASGDGEGVDPVALQAAASIASAVSATRTVRRCITRFPTISAGSRVPSAGDGFDPAARRSRP